MDPQPRLDKPTTIPTEWEVTPEAIASWYAAHPDAVLGQDVKVIILAERRLAALRRWAELAAFAVDAPERERVDALLILGEELEAAVTVAMERVTA